MAPITSTVINRHVKKMYKNGASAAEIKEYLDKPSHRVAQIGETVSIYGLTLGGGSLKRNVPIPAIGLGGLGVLAISDHIAKNNLKKGDRKRFKE